MQRLARLPAAPYVRLLRLDVPWARTMAPFSSCYRSTAGSFQPCVDAHCDRLRPAEREDISRGIASGSSIREIAGGLQRAASTVSREVARHGGRPVYRASEADHQAWKLALRPKACLLANHRKLRLIVASKLILDWSPEQISGWLKRQYPSNESMRVSHETIYRSLFIQARGVLKRADAAPAIQAIYPSLGAPSGWWTVPRSDRRCHLYPGKACRD